MTNFKQRSSKTNKEIIFSRHRKTFSLFHIKTVYITQTILANLTQINTQLLRSILYLCSADLDLH